MRYLIDTDTIIFFLKGKFSLNKKIEAVGLENCFVSIITIAELFFGVGNSTPEYVTRRELEAKAIREKFNVVTLENAVQIYGQQKAKLKREGNRIEDNDLFIGATAIGNNMTLVTRNTKHFERLDNIQLEDWTKQEDNEFIP